MAIAEQTIKKMRVDLPAWLHKEIRKEAAERELSMMQTAIGILEEYFEKRREPRGGRK